MFSMLMHGSGGEAMPGSVSMINEFSTNLSIFCFSDNIDNPTFIAQPRKEYGFMFDINRNQYWDCSFQAKLATPFRSGTFLFWGNPNIPSSHSSQLDNCMTCNWKVSNDGLFLQQSDHTFLLRWTRSTIPDSLTDAVWSQLKFSLEVRYPDKMVQHISHSNYSNYLFSILEILTYIWSLWSCNSLHIIKH